MSQVISEIAKAIVGLKFIELDTQEVPAFGKNPYGEKPRFIANKIPTKTLIVESITHRENEDWHTINYVNPDNWSRTYIIVPNNFLASILPIEKYAELEKKYIEYMLNNLSDTVAFQGTLGSDPEIFVENGDGQIIPAFDFLGDKKNPLIANSGAYHGNNKIYWDGFQAEFETTYSICFCHVADSIQNALKGLLGAARKHNKNAKLSFRTVFDIPPEVMLKAKPEHVQFGCMPSFNAYNMHGLQKSGDEVTFRPAGGHIHLGLPTPLKNKETIEKMVKAMDAILGVACVSLFAKFDEPRRRELYGLAGEYRIPPHGMEYRVLSNAWLIHPVIAHMVFDLGRSAAMLGARDLLGYWKCDEAETVRIINSCDVDAARKVLETNKDLLKKLIKVRYDFNYKNHRGMYNVEPSLLTDYSYDVFMKGLESIIANTDDIAGNWSLDGTWVTHSNGPSKNVFKVFQAGAEKKKV